MLTHTYVTTCRHCATMYQLPKNLQVSSSIKLKHIQYIYIYVLIRYEMAFWDEKYELYGIYFMSVVTCEERLAAYYYASWRGLSFGLHLFAILGLNFDCLEECAHWALKWHHNECHGVSNHPPHDCLLNCLFRCKSKKTSKLHVTGLCEGNTPVMDKGPVMRKMFAFYDVIMETMVGWNNPLQMTTSITNPWHFTSQGSQGSTCHATQSFITPGKPQLPQLSCPCRVHLLAGIFSLRWIPGPNPSHWHSSADKLLLCHSARLKISDLSLFFCW